MPEHSLEKYSLSDVGTTSTGVLRNFLVENQRAFGAEVTRRYEPIKLGVNECAGHIMKKLTRIHGRGCRNGADLRICSWG
jgi:hypothetical protein